MFKFNFSVENEDDERSKESTTCVEEIVSDSNSNQVPFGIIDFEELDTLSEHNERLDSKFFKKFMLDDANFVEYFYIENSNLLNLIKNNENLIEITKTHDLENGKYEGGFKVWECSMDLSSYLYSNYHTDLSELSIFELGCGHALPSLSLIKRLLSIKNSKLKTVNLYLQDYNRDCIELITYLNVKKFLVDNSEELTRCFEKLNIKFVFGDWKSVESLLPSNSFDLLLTSETIYNRLYYKSLLELCKHLLRDASSKLDFDSCILLAAKTCYFGCSGSLHEFLNSSKLYNFKFSENLLVNRNQEEQQAIIHGSVSREIILLNKF